MQTNRARSPDTSAYLSLLRLCCLTHIIRSRVRPAVIAAAPQLGNMARNETVSEGVLLETQRLVLRQFTMADVDNLVRPAYILRFHARGDPHARVAGLMEDYEFVRP